MASSAGHRRPRFTDAVHAWTERLSPLFAADHPGHPRRYDTYVNHLAFLTAGTVEHHWGEEIAATGRPPFAPLRHPDTFKADLQRHIRAFREIRFTDGLGSASLVRQSYELLNFLSERVPSAEFERYLGVARIYIRQNEDECLAS